MLAERSPSLDNHISPISTSAALKQYIPLAPHLDKNLSCPRSTTNGLSGSYYSSISEPPTTVSSATISSVSITPISISPAFGSLSRHSDNEYKREMDRRRSDSPPFLDQENFHEITCNGQLIQSRINAEIVKGFFMSLDNCWTSYRRNYFAVKCSYTLSPYPENGQLFLHESYQKQQQPIQALAICLAAARSDGGVPIDLIQHTPKRDKGPVRLVKLAPTPPALKQTPIPPLSHGFMINTCNESIQHQIQPSPYLPLQKVDDYNTPPDTQGGHPQRTSSPTAHDHTFERVQFKSATANNGKRRAHQQYFILMVELWADVRNINDKEPKWEKIAQRGSDQLVVRGRSPSHYSNKGPHIASLRSGSSDLSGIGLGNLSLTGGVGAPDDTCRTVYGLQYSPRYRGQTYHGNINMHPTPTGSTSTSCTSVTSSTKLLPTAINDLRPLDYNTHTNSSLTTNNDSGYGSNYSPSTEVAFTRQANDSATAPSSVRSSMTTDESSIVLKEEPLTPETSTSNVETALELSEDMESNDESGRDEGFPSLDLVARKIALEDQLMEHFLTFFKACAPSPVHTQTPTGDGCLQTRDGQDAGSNGQSSSHNGSKSRSKKRGREDITGENDDHLGGGNQQPGKRVKKGVSNRFDTSPLFACPFFKRDRQRYQRQRLCPGPGWTTVHRLKEHLYRNHKMPYQCPRCCREFSSQLLLLEHQRNAIPCPVQDGGPIEGIDAEKERQLRSRKREQQNMTEEDKWRKVYRILFPNDDYSKMPSPYYDDDLSSEMQNERSLTRSAFARYEAFLRRELPSSIRRELETRVDELLDHTEETLRNQLPSIFRDVQIRLFQDYVQQWAVQSAQPSAITSDQNHDTNTEHNENSVDATTTERDSLAQHITYNPVLWDPEAWTWDNDINMFNGAIFTMAPDHATSLNPMPAVRSEEEVLKSV